MGNKSETEKPTASGLLASRITSAFVLCLLHRRAGKMSRQRLVGRLQSLALADPAAFYCCAAGYSHPIQIRSASSRNLDLSARGELPNFHLDQKNQIHLVGLHSGDARRDRTLDGLVPFRTRDDRDEHRSLRRCF